VRLPLYDVHWPTAVVLERAMMKGGYESIRVGLRDGRVLPLSSGSDARRRLAVNDVIYVHVTESKNQGIKVELRVKPTVQAAAVVLENKTGRVLAMVGGFSYPASQLNRAAQSRRQPGSSFKPMSYLAALANGLQPNTLAQDTPITLPPIGGSRYATDQDWWTPKNYDGGYAGAMTLRRALENSKNLVTAQLLDGGISASPAESLDRVCRLAIEAQLYTQCERYYPFVLGAQPVRPVDLAGFYASVANEGARPTPHIIESIEQNGQTIYRAKQQLVSIGSADRPAFYQLKTMLQGVLSRGTARAAAHLAPYVGGKTGTSDEENDAWFVGFSNEVTIAVWVGYDNARGKRTLGPGQTGGKVALPIFMQIMQAVWDKHAPRTALSGPSPEASRQLIALPIDLRSGERLNSGSPGAFTEYFRLDRTGRFVETQHRLVSREQSYTLGGQEPWSETGRSFQREFPFFFAPPPPQRYEYHPPRYESAPRPPNYIAPRQWSTEQAPRPPRGEPEFNRHRVY
jgi:penicillin-binding protein 1A